MLDNRQGLNILWVTVTHTIKGTVVKPHTHEYYHLTHVYTGTLVCEINGDEINVGEGMTLLVPPGVSHGQRDVLPDLAVACEVKFFVTDSTLKKMLERTPILIAASEDAVRLMERVVSESVRFSTTARDCMYSFLNALLHIWAREYYKEDEEASFSIFDTSTFSTLTKSILRYLEEKYATNVNLEDLSKELGYNKHYMCNAFKQDTGSTIFDCLSLIRVRRAAELISYSETSLENVAANIGFSSLSHFNHIFKQTVGITPGQYRRHYPSEILTVEEAEPNVDRDKYADIVKSNYAEPFIVSVLARQKISGDMLNQIIRKSANK